MTVYDGHGENLHAHARSCHGIFCIPSTYTGKIRLREKERKWMNLDKR